jgi:2-desacetyl-2-hydroxyethyl bacteriochlorophyllide A dehydrogenase
VLDGPRRLRLAEQPSRPLQPGEIRLRARLSGISHGTELSLYRGTSAFTDKVFDRGLRAFVAPHAGSAAGYPVTLGYEMVAEVVEAAPDVTEVKVGDLVHTGTPHQEETVLDVAASLAATYPLVRLPTAERPERVLFISLAAVALQAVHDAEIKLGDAVSVHGLGAIGLLAVQMCRLEGIQNVFAVDPDPQRRQLAARFGATQVLDPTGEVPTGLQVHELNMGHGVDVAIEVSGSDRALQDALASAGLGGWDGGGGRLLPGRRRRPAAGRGVPPQPAVPDRIDRRLGRTRPARAAVDRRRMMATATRLLYTDRVSVQGLLGRTFAFGDAPAAYRWIDEHPQAAVKVALAY